MKVDILAVGVHPDDVELGCSGTILKAVLDGKKRSIYFSLITRLKNKFLFTYKYLYKNIFNSFFTKIFYDNDSISKISEIKELLKLLNFSLIVMC